MSGRTTAPNARAKHAAPQRAVKADAPVEIVTRATYHGLRAMRPLGAPRRRLHAFSMADAVIALVIVLAALAARWPFVMAGETLLNPDEAIVGLMAMDIRAGESLPIYFYGQRYMGSLEAFILAALLPLFEDAVHALRFGPACVFAVFAAVQFLMCRRWFGRLAGVVAAAVSIACAPMFMHWTVSARGGYIEVLLWGTVLLWAYSEWFTGWRGEVPVAEDDAAAVRRRTRRQFMFGALIGSGFWINPSIVLFVAPVVLHALLNRPLAALDRTPDWGALLGRVRGVFRTTTLPIVAIAAVLCLNMISAVWVEENGRVRYMVMLDLVPPAVAGVLLAVGAVVAAYFIARRTGIVQQVRPALQRHGALIFGALVGATPACIYAGQVALGYREMEPSLPMGVRPLWLMGETMVYFIYGLPLLFSPAAEPFIRLMNAGRPDIVQPLDPVMQGFVSGAGWLALGGMMTVVFILTYSRRRFLSRLLSLRPGMYPPAVLLMLGFGVTVGLYLLGGCTMNFSTIRYLVPIWAFVPGLVAAACTRHRLRWAGVVGAACLCAAWAVGQAAMHRQLGTPHPLRGVQAALIERGVDRGIAEPLDAHLLSFMTERRCRLAEFESFWVRLPHHRALIDPKQPVNYVVETATVDRADTWVQAGWPGTTPPETMRFLWPRMQWVLANQPDLLVSREPLGEGYELIQLRRPIEERTVD